ncbi:response regulator [Bacteroidota bacterium]
MKAKISIICFEDNPGDFLLFKEKLSEANIIDFDLAHVSRLQDGVKLLETSTTDIAILDLGLPDSKGINTFYKLQSKFPDLAIIVITGNDDVNIGIEAVHKGAQDYLIKSDISTSLLVRSIMYSIKRKEANVELKYARDKAKEADILKSAFLANMSHDLRTPMNSIIGFSELLKECKNDKERSEYIKVIVKNGEVLLNLLNDIIDLSKIEAGQLNINMKSVNIRKILEVLEKVYQEKKKELKKDHLILMFAAPEQKDCKSIITDDIRIQQIFINLLDNALKFTKEGSIIFGCDIEGDVIKFYVKDTGIGISKEKQDIIFERFGKISETEYMNSSGSGLGLAISKNLTLLLGGDMWVESEEGKGAKFVFTIPYTVDPTIDVENDNDEITKKDSFNWKDKTILLVEDIESNQKLIQYSLQKTNVNLITVNSGEKAIEICKSMEDIDLILMDIRLPGLNGFETSKEILKFRKVPIIAQTALILTNEKEKCFEFGCIDYIAKPIRADELRLIIAKHI